MKNTSSMMKTFSTGLFIGAFVALCISLMGSFSIFMYGVIHPPQHIHLSLLSQDFLDFSSTSATKFELLINPQGMLGLIIVIMLIVAIIFWILKRLFHPSPTR